MNEIADIGTLSWSELFDEYDRVFSMWLRSQVQLSSMAVRITDLEAQVQELRQDL